MLRADLGKNKRSRGSRGEGAKAREEAGRRGRLGLGMEDGGEGGVTCVDGEDVRGE
jgi:hypothetical protein